MARCTLVAEQAPLTPMASQHHVAALDASSEQADGVFRELMQRSEGPQTEGLIHT